MGTSYSFEQYFQAIHRLYRHGQLHPVDTHLVYAETSGSVRQNLAEKQQQYEVMQSQLRKILQSTQLQFKALVQSEDYQPQIIQEIPSWLKNKVA
jgi:hypothetical protein